MPRNPSEQPGKIGRQVLRLARQSADLLTTAINEQNRSLGNRLFGALRSSPAEAGEDPGIRLQRLGTTIMDRYQQLQSITPASEGETTEEAVQRYETVMTLLVHPDAQAILGSIPEKLPGAFEQIHGLAFGLTGSMGTEAWIAKTFERLRILGQDIDYLTFYSPSSEGTPMFTELHQAVNDMVIAPFCADNAMQRAYLNPEVYTDLDLTNFRDENWLIPNLADAQDAKQRLRQIIRAEPLPLEQEQTFTGDPLAIATHKLFAFFTMSFPPEVNMRNRRLLFEGLSQLESAEWQEACNVLTAVAKRYFGEALKEKHLLGDSLDPVGKRARRRAEQTDFRKHFQETLQASVAFKLGLFTAMLDTTGQQAA